MRLVVIAALTLTAAAHADPINATYAIRVTLPRDRGLQVRVNDDPIHPMSPHAVSSISVRIPTKQLAELGSTQAQIRGQVRGASIPIPGLAPTAYKTSVEHGDLVIRTKAPVVDGVLKMQALPIQLHLDKGETVGLLAKSEHALVDTTPLSIADARSFYIGGKHAIANRRARIATLDGAITRMSSPSWTPPPGTGDAIVTPERKAAMIARNAKEKQSILAEDIPFWEAQNARMLQQIATLKAHPTVFSAETGPTTRRADWTRVP